MKFAICNETFQGWEWEAICPYVAEAGYDGIEIAPFTLADDVRSIDASRRGAIRQTAQRAGLEVVGLHWLLVSPIGLSMTSPDSAVRQATSEYVIALVDFCGDVGGRIMVFGSPAQRRIADSDSREAAEERFASAIRPALNRAADRGITICLEPLPAPEANYLLTLAEAVALMKRLDHPAAKTIFDVKSASSEGVPLPEIVERFTPYIAHVHANDANRRGPGFGETDFKPVLAALDKAGYDGWVSVEVFDYSPDPQTIATESLRYLMACLPA